MSDFSDNILPKGFTGHEHFSEIALIHMNGRMYDPQMRRFLSPDNFVSDPYDTRSYDRFGYVWQNPLMTIDPSGEEPLTIAAVLAFIGKAVAVHQGIRTAYGYSSGYYTGLGPLVNAGIQVATAFIPGASLGSELINLVPAAKTGAGAFIRVAGASAVQGFVSSTVGSVISGASLTDALRAGLQGAAFAAGTAVGLEAITAVGAKIQKGSNLNHAEPKGYFEEALGDFISLEALMSRYGDSDMASLLSLIPKKDYSGVLGKLSYLASGGVSNGIQYDTGGNPTGYNFIVGGTPAVGIGRLGSAARGVTTADGFLFRGFTVKAPVNIPVQRFGNMSLGRPDFWGARIGTSQFANRTFGAIKPAWNPLTQYTTGVIPKGTPIKFGIIGPQGWRYPGGSFQFIIPSRSVINQSSKLIR